MRRRMSWDCRRHRGHTRRSLGNSFLLAVPNYVDWRICMGIVDAELFIVGAGEEKIESKSSRLQCVDSISTTFEAFEWKYRARQLYAPLGRSFGETDQTGRDRDARKTSKNSASEESEGACPVSVYQDEFFRPTRA
jgi:hypothetical protein